MRSILAVTALAILGNLDVALASVCKPHPTNGHITNTITTAAPTTSETKGPLVVKNVVTNGNFAIRDPENPGNIPGYTTEGQAQIVSNKGYTGENSKELGCVEMSASNGVTKHKRAIGNIVSISQQLDDLDTRKKYTVRFFYAVITASSINVCTLSASIGGHQFYTSTILSIGQAIDWNTVLTQTDVPNTQGAFSVSVNCPVGGVAAIYVDSIFMSNQVTPETINDVSIDYGDESDVSSTSATSRLPAESTTSNAPNSKESTHEPSTQTGSQSGAQTLTSEAAHTTTGFSTGSDVNTFSSSTESGSGSKTITYGSTDTQTRDYTPTSASDSSVVTQTKDHTPTTSSDNSVSTESSLPSGSRVCPAGAPPPGYCTPVQPQVTQTVSLPGITIESDNDRPTAPRACWAFGRPKTGTWGRVKSYHPRQNSIADCALLCKQEGSNCKAFALNTFDQEVSCSFLYDRLGVSGIELNKQWSLVWNDFDCFECHDCDIKNTADASTETSEIGQSSTPLPESTTEAAVMTSVATSATASADDSTSQALTSTVPTAEQTTTTPSRTEPPTTFVSSYVPTTTESTMPQCTLALSDGCVFDQNYEYSDCNQQGTFRSTFTLKEGEYPWQVDTRNCIGLCYHMPHRCKASGWDQNLQTCVFSSHSIHDSSFTPGNGDGSQYWSEQGCNRCFCHDQDRNDYYASLATALPTATCAPSIASEAAVCEIKQNPSSDLVCQHSGYFPWAFDDAPSKFPFQDSEERCAALCNSNPDCVASAWSEEYGKCAIGYHQLKYIQWQQFGSTELSWSDKGCWDCSDCIKSQKWRIVNV